MLNKIVGLLLISVVTLACSEMSLREGYGDSTVNNADIQTLNKDASSKNYRHTLDGQKAELVMERYRTEEEESSAAKLVTEISED